MSKLNTQFPGKNVLVVEDYPINQEIVREMLELMGCTVDIAADGQVALEKALHKRYDLIIMDIQLPEKDGYEVTREIRRAESKSTSTPIVALTANALTNDQQKCLEAGMNDYLAKPIELSRLEATLKKYIKA